MSLGDFLALIFVFNLLTFGSGLAMIPLLQHQLVEQSRVLTLDQLLYAITIARLTPGPNNVYVASVGYMLFGLPGALLTTLTTISPSLLMLPLMRGYERVQGALVMQRLTRGLACASIGVIFAATVELARNSVTTPIAALVFVLTLFETYILRWNAVLSLAVASSVGIGLTIVFQNPV